MAGERASHARAPSAHASTFGRRACRRPSWPHLAPFPADNEPLPHDVAHSNETVVVSYLKPNVTVNMIDDFRWAFAAACLARCGCM